MTNVAESFYWTGGNVPAGAVSYVPRKSDTSLFDHLLKGDFCYVLTTRQMGKSSLMVQMVHRLRERGTAAAVVDFSSMGYQLSALQWYSGLLEQIGRALKLEDEIEDFIEANARMSPIQLWHAALRDVFLARTSTKITIFMDEIDFVRRLSFSVDEFFASIRSCYNLRSEDSSFSRLTFCLLGVASPTDLINDPSITPFNVGDRIDLEDFTRDEVMPLARGLGRDSSTNLALMERIYHWTHGHPFLTQRLCKSVADAEDGSQPDIVDACCKNLFFLPASDQRETNLAFVRQRILAENDERRAALLTLYKRALTGQRVLDSEANEEIAQLKLTGVVRTDAGYLTVRNLIYAQVFNRKWVDEHMPDAETRRQRAAVRRGFLQASIPALIALAIVTAALLFSVARYRSERDAKRDAQTQAEIARKATSKAEAEGENAKQQEHAAKQAQAKSEALGKQHKADADRNSNLVRALESTNKSLDKSQRKARKSSHAATITKVHAQASEKVARVVAYVNGYNALQSEWNQSHVKEFDALFHSLARQNREMHYPSFEIEYWRRLRDQGKVQLLPYENPSSLAVYAGGRRALIACGSRIFDMDCSKIDQPPRAAIFRTESRQNINSVAISNDRTVLLGGPGGVEMFDLNSPNTTTRRIQLPDIGHDTSNVRAVAFSPNHRVIAVGSYSGVGFIIDCQTLKVLSVLNKAESPAMTSIAFEPKGDLMLAGSDDGKADLWDIREPASPKRVGDPIGSNQNGYVLSVAYSNDGKRCAAAHANGKIDLWSPANPIDIRVLTSDGPSASWVTFSHDSNLLISTGIACHIWNVSTGELRQTLRGHRGSIVSAAFLDTDDTILTAAAKPSEVGIWKVAEYGSVSRVVREVCLDAYCGAFSPDDRTLAYQDETGKLRTWNFESDSRRLTAELPAGYLTAAAYTPDGQILLTCLFDSVTNVSRLKLWNAQNLAPIRDLAEFRSRISCAISPDGKWIAALTEDGTINVWQTAGGRLVRRWRQGAEPLNLGLQNCHTLAFSANSDRIFASHHDGIVVYDFRRNTLIKRIEGLGDVTAVASSLKRNLIAVTANDYSIRLFDALTYRQVQQVRDHSDAITSLDFSLNGQRLLSASTDHSILVWDTNTWSPLLSIKGHKRGVNQAIMSPDGRHVASFGFGGQSFLW